MKLRTATSCIWIHRWLDISRSGLPALYRQLRDNLAAIPGVNRVSFGLYTPMEGNNWGETIYIEGQAPPPAGSSQNQTSWLRVTDGYFESIGTKIVKGRTITEQDTASTRKIAVVNQTFARHFFKDEDPIGKHFGDLDQKYAGSFEIVGVTEDTQYRDATHKIPPMFFLPEAQNVVYDDPRFKAFEDSNHFLNTAVLQTQGPVPGLEPQVRRAFAQVSPDLPVIDFMSFAAQVDGNFAQNQMLAKLTSLFGLLALVLASVGLYGVTAYSVERRTSEIGIRMALGADRLNVLTAGAEGRVCADWSRTGDRHSGNDSGGICNDDAIVRSEALRSGYFAGDDARAEPGSAGGHGAARPQGSSSGTDSRAADRMSGLDGQMASG